MYKAVSNTVLSITKTFFLFVVVILIAVALLFVSDKQNSVLAMVAKQLPLEVSIPLDIKRMTSSADSGKVWARFSKTELIYHLNKRETENFGPIEPFDINPNLTKKYMAGSTLSIGPTVDFTLSIPGEVNGHGLGEIINPKENMNFSQIYKKMFVYSLGKDITLISECLGVDLNTTEGNSEIIADRALFASVLLENKLSDSDSDDKLRANSDKRENEPFHSIIIQTSNRYQVDPLLVKAIIMAESTYNPKAVSRTGAKGLMQLMPITAKELGVKDLFNPEQNIDGGVRYFKKLLDRFDGDINLALAAYNAGSKYVRRYQGVPPFKATQQYIKKVGQYYEGYKEQYQANTGRV